MTNSTLKKFVNILLNGTAVLFDGDVGEVKLNDENTETLKFFNLFKYGLISSQAQKIRVLGGLPEKFIPETSLIVLIQAILNVDNGRAIHSTCAAFWALALCLVGPWVTDGSKKVKGRGAAIYFALNELLRRMCAFHGGDYYAVQDNSNENACKEVKMSNVYRELKQSTEFSDLPLTVHSQYRFAHTHNSEVENLIKNLEVLTSEEQLPNTTGFLKRNVKFEIEKTDVTRNAGVLSRLIVEDYQTFSNGGILLINTPSGSGYDFVIADGKCLTFYGVEYSRDTSDSYNQSCKYDACEAEFEEVKNRAGHAFSEWRLIVFSHNDKTAKSSRHNMFILGPEEINKMFAPMFMSHLVFSTCETEREMIESFKNQTNVSILKELLELEELELKFKLQKLKQL